MSFKNTVVNIAMNKTLADTVIGATGVLKFVAMYRRYLVVRFNVSAPNRLKIISTDALNIAISLSTNTG